MTAPARKYMTVEEYMAFEASSEQKHEYSDGRIYAMAGASFAHNFIVANLIGKIRTFLEDKDCYVLPSDVRITVPKFTSYMYPGVTIFCGDLAKQEGVFDTLTNPSVIIEVLSSSTRGIDVDRKRFKYIQIPSLTEYIIVDTADYQIESLIRQHDQTFSTIFTRGHDATLTISTIQMQLPLKDIYYKVTLEE